MGVFLSQVITIDTLIPPSSFRMIVCPSVKDVRKLFRARNLGAVFVTGGIITSVTVNIVISACHTTVQLTWMQ